MLWNAEEELNLEGINQLKSEKSILGRGNNTDKCLNAWHSIMNLGSAVGRTLSLICEGYGAVALFFKTLAYMRHLTV